MAGETNTGKKGFSGLADLVSKVDLSDEVQKPPHLPEVFLNTEAQKPPRPSATGPSHSAPPAQRRDPKTMPEPQKRSAGSTPPAGTAPSGKSGGIPAKVWVFVGIGMFLAFWLAANARSNKRTYVPPPTTTSQSSTTPHQQAAPPAQAVPPAPPKEPHLTGLNYTIPQIGTDRILSVTEIRWCTAKKIIIETSRDLIETDKGIAEFNTMVEDYNSRCGNYRYKKGALEQAKADVERYRSQIVAGVTQAVQQANLDQARLNQLRPNQALRSQALRSQASSSSSSASPSSALQTAPTAAPNPATPQEVKEAQQLLAKLGYAPGPADGQPGRRTVDAVKAFQRKAGITQDGNIDQFLLALLQRTAKQQTITLEGQYMPVEKDVRGGFIIKREGADYTIALELVSPAYHTCGFENTGQREGNVLLFDASYDQTKAMVRIVFSDTGAELEDIGGASRNFCGLNAYMEGTYIKKVR